MKSKSLKLNTLLNGVRITLSMIFPLITFPYDTRSRVFRSRKFR